MQANHFLEFSSSVDYKQEARIFEMPPSQFFIYMIKALFVPNSKTLQHLAQKTITLKMADQERSDLDVVFTMILCATNFFSW